MSWTPRAARRRPRFSSFGFRTFGWLVHREACLRIIYAEHVGTALEQGAREAIYRARRDRLDTYAQTILTLHRPRATFTRDFDVMATFSPAIHRHAAEPITCALPVPRGQHCAVCDSVHVFPATPEPPRPRDEPPPELF